MFHFSVYRHTIAILFLSLAMVNHAAHKHNKNNKRRPIYAQAAANALYRRFCVLHDKIHAHILKRAKKAFLTVLGLSNFRITFLCNSYMKKSYLLKL